MTRSGAYKSARKRPRESAARSAPAPAPNYTKALSLAIVVLLFCAVFLIPLLLPDKKKTVTAAAPTGAEPAATLGTETTPTAETTGETGDAPAKPAALSDAEDAASTAPAAGQTTKGVRLDIRVRPHADNPLADLAEFEMSAGAEPLPPSSALSNDGYFAKAALFPLASRWQAVTFSFLPDSESLIECSLYSSSDFLVDNVVLGGITGGIATHGSFEAVETKSAPGSVTEIYVTTDEGTEDRVALGKNLSVRTEGALEGEKCLAVAGGDTEPGPDCAPVRFTIRTQSGKKATVKLHLRAAAM